MGFLGPFSLPAHVSPLIAALPPPCSRTGVAQVGHTSSPAGPSGGANLPSAHREAAIRPASPACRVGGSARLAGWSPGFLISLPLADLPGHGPMGRERREDAPHRLV